MDKASPRDFLRGLETAKTTFVHVECDVVRAAIREAIALELEQLAEKHAEDIRQTGPRPYLLGRAREVRNGLR